MKQKLLPYFISLIMLTLMTPTHGACQALDPEMDRRFPWITFDTLHLNTRYFSSLDIGAHQPLALDTTLLRSNALHCIGKFKFEPSGRHIVYVSGSPRRNQIMLDVLDPQSENLLHLNAANWNYLPGAMESVTNTWILDVDGDGIYEIFVVTILEDFEMPTDESPNISGTKKYCYRWVQGKWEYQEWPGGLELGPLLH